MTRNPATPKKRAPEASTGSSGSRSIEPTSAPKPKHNAMLHEPSPASTYCDTVATGSVPATPKDINDEDIVGPSTQLTNATTIGEAPDSIHGSPTANASSSRGLFRTGSLAKQPIRKDSSCSSPAKDTNSSKADSINDEMSPFVRQNKASKTEDPFVSSTAGAVQQATPTRRGKFTKTPSPTQKVGDSTPSQTVSSPTPNRDGMVLCNENAQAYLRPSACVFVANLSTNCTDEHLEKSVHDVFKDFGPVYIKIRRDSRGMPFAFCQYEQDEDATRAIKEGRNKYIDGRPCRTEPARVNRSLYMSRLAGGRVTEAEARQAVQHFGAIERIWRPSDTEQEMYHLCEGIWVKFEYFQDCRDAQAAFRDDTTYRLEHPAAPFDRRSAGRVPGSPGNRQNGGGAPSPTRGDFTAQQLLRRSNIDRRSIFVGSLTMGMTEDRLGRIFSAYGNIISVEVVTKPSATGAASKVFAFIEFSSEVEATNAIDNTDQTFLDNHRIKVERKESNDLRLRRPPQTTNASPTTTRGNRGFANGQGSMAQVYDQGYSPFSPGSGTVNGPLVANGTFTSPGSANQTMMSHGAMVPTAYGYPYYPAHANPFSNTSPQASYNVTQAESDVNNLHVSGIGYGSSGSLQAGYWPSQLQGSSVSPSRVSSQTASATGMYSQAMYGQQPMGQFQYPQGPMAYPQYPAYYPMFSTSGGSQAHANSYNYSPQVNQQTAHSVDSTGQGGEQNESR